MTLADSGPPPEFVTTVNPHWILWVEELAVRLCVEGHDGCRAIPCVDAIRDARGEAREWESRRQHPAGSALRLVDG